MTPIVLISTIHIALRLARSLSGAAVAFEAAL
jgi:hypothetical protein